MTLRMDWQQVVLNGGPPCFHIDHESPDRYCGRVQRWNGHDHDHKFVSLDDLLTTARKEARAEAFTDAAQTLRDKAEDWRSQSERWQQNAENVGMDIIREQDYADRDACLSKMAAAITLAIEFDEAAAVQKGDDHG